eukprot:1967456-Prymnesium_polylepis.1
MSEHLPDMVLDLAAVAFQLALLRVGRHVVRHAHQQPHAAVAPLDHRLLLAVRPLARRWPPPIAAVAAIAVVAIVVRRRILRAAAFAVALPVVAFAAFDAALHSAAAQHIAPLRPD